MKKTPLGLCSCVFAALVWIGLWVAIVVINQISFSPFKNETHMFVLQFGVFTVLVMTLLGVGLAIGGLRQTDRKRVFAVLGLIFNGLVLLGALGVVCLAVVAPMS
jgi:hypothetical protein